jgi:hypothetical protein
VRLPNLAGLLEYGINVERFTLFALELSLTFKFFFLVCVGLRSDLHVWVGVYCFGVSARVCVVIPYFKGFTGHVLFVVQLQTCDT